jgi:hypothetical protein
MPCKDKELVTAIENHYKALRNVDIQPGFQNFLKTILNNGAAVDMETSI